LEGQQFTGRKVKVLFKDGEVLMGSTVSLLSPFIWTLNQRILLELVPSKYRNGVYSLLPTITNYKITLESTNNYMNQYDFARVLDTIPQLRIRKWIDNDVKMLFKILYWSALRPIEGIMLSKEQFNLTNRIINLGQTKTQKNARAIIPLVFID